MEIFKAKLLLLLSHISHVRLCNPIDGSPPGSRPWDSPGKNTGVGCHFLLQRMKVKSESEDAQSCPTLRDPTDCSPPGSSIHGISQARVLEWVAIVFSESQTIKPQIPCFSPSFWNNSEIEYDIHLLINCICFFLLGAWRDIICHFVDSSKSFV